MSSLITIERVDKLIERMSFDCEALKKLEIIYFSSPDCNVPANFNLHKILPSHDDKSNLEKLEKYLKSAANTIRNYLKNLLVNSPEHMHKMHKKKIRKEDILIAFSGKSHLKVIEERMGKRYSSSNLVWLIDGQKFTSIEYLFMHALSVCKLEEEKNILVGYHKNGIKIKGLYFPGPNSARAKLFKPKSLALIHFATIVTELNDLSILDEIESYQKRYETYQDLLSKLSGREIDFTNNGKLDSILNWTKERFNNYQANGKN